MWSQEPRKLGVNLTESWAMGSSRSPQARDTGSWKRLRKVHLSPALTSLPSHPALFHLFTWRQPRLLFSCVSFQNILCIYVQICSPACASSFSNTGGGKRATVLHLVLFTSLQELEMALYPFRQSCRSFFTAVEYSPARLTLLTHRWEAHGWALRVCLAEPRPAVAGGCDRELWLKGQVSSAPGPSCPTAPGLSLRPM